jgi:multidrug efflux system membrane fusion protein
MKVVPLIVGGLALVAVGYGGFVLLNPGHDPAVASQQQTQAPAPGKAAPPAPSAQRVLPPAPVVVSLVKTADVPVTLSVIGNVQAMSTVAIKSQVDGQIVEVHFREGQTVKKGDLLFTLDPRPYESALRQAEANLAKDKALLAKAQADLARNVALVRKDYTSRSNYDQAVANAASLEATIKGDEAVVEQARLKLEFTRITAPIDGRVGSILVSPGNLVKANDTAAGSTLVTLNQIKPIYVQFSVPENRLAEIRARMAEGKILVRAQIPEDTQAPVEGILSFVNNAVDSSTGTILLKATYTNDDGRLTPGQFVNVTVELSVIPGAVVVPPAAVQIGQRGQYVFVVKDNDTVEVRPVKTGVRTDRDVVIEDGLKVGEKVVTEGQLRLRPNARVTVLPPGGPTPPGRARAPEGPPG